MRRHAKGFSGLEIAAIIVAAAVLTGAIAGAIHLVTSYLDGVRKEAFEAGQAKCDAAYKARDNEQLVKVQRELVDALKAKEAAEKAARVAQKALADKVKKEKADAEETAARTLADLDSGALVLRDGVVQTVRCPADDGGQAQGANAGGVAAGTGAKTCYRLAPHIERAAVEADKLVKSLAAQVNGLLDQRAADLKLCNGGP